MVLFTCISIVRSSCRYNLRLSFHINYRFCNQSRYIKYSCFFFTINSDTDIATFEMVKNDVTVRKHTSLPFPAGSLKHVSILCLCVFLWNTRVCILSIVIFLSQKLSKFGTPGVINFWIFLQPWQYCTLLKSFIGSVSFLNKYLWITPLNNPVLLRQMKYHEKEECC